MTSAGQGRRHYLAKAYAGKNIAVIDDKTTYGRGLAEETREELAAAYGMRQFCPESINGGEKDFSAGLKIKAAQAVKDVSSTHADAGLSARCATRASRRR